MKLRLSEAIRLGAILKPQAFGHYFYQDGGSCALVAASEAMGVEYSKIDWNVIVKEAGLPLECPECGVRPKHPAGVISLHLNDRHRWTRERIASFVESIEQQIELQQEKPQERATEFQLVKEN